MNPLILRMERFHSNDDATIGIVESEKHCLFTCEDEHRQVKVAKETRIPEGVYPIRLRTEGGMIKRYKMFQGLSTFTSITATPMSIQTGVFSLDMVHS